MLNGPTRTHDVVVIGGGVIGLSVALELQLRGVDVLVLDANRVGHGSTWAAAGMLAAHDPAHLPLLQPLADLSVRLYPEFLAAIERHSGIAVPILTRQAIELLPKSSPGADSPFKISASEACELIPQLSEKAAGNSIVLKLAEWSLDPRKLVAGLAAACMSAGVSIIEDQLVTELHQTAKGLSIATDQMTYAADQAIICAGWNSSAILPPDLALPIGPRKGQILALRDPHSAPLQAVVRSEDVYIVPRLDGTLIIGSTAEHGRTSLETDDPTLKRLQAAAAGLLPALRHAERLDAWAGIRPGTPDDLPILAKLGPRVYLATGHFRNGLLLAPATARLMAQLISEVQPDIDLDPFRAARFANPYAPKL